MSIVLVDVPVVTATLLSGGDPRPVQVVVSGLTAGQSVSVVAVTTAGAESSVPGGVLVSDGSQLVLTDNRTPLNTPVRYRATVDGVPYLSDEVTVIGPRYLIQSLDGQKVAEFVWRDNGLPGEPDLYSVVFPVPGRARPPARLVPGGAGGGELDIRTDRANGARLLELLLSGRPLVVRTDGQIRDFPAVEIILPLRGPNGLWGAMTPDGPSTDRVWKIGYVLVDDPEPSQILAGSTGADFDAAMADRVWSGTVTTVRTNLATRPRPSESATGWGFQNGTGETTTGSPQTTPGAGPEGRTGFLRRVVTALKTAGLSGHYYRESGLSGVAGDVRSFGAWVRFSHDVSAAISIQFRTGSTTTGGSFAGTSTTVPANVWTYLTFSATATGSYDTVQVWPQVSVSTPVPIGGYYDVTDVLIETGSVPGAYHDGSMPDTPTVDHAWTGPAFNSMSTETTTVLTPGSFDALFQYSTGDDFDAYDWRQLL